jgi:hypothetical protein
MSVLRRASRFWKPAQICKANARIHRGLYKCSNPLCAKVVGQKEIKIDHIEPVVPVEGADSWDIVIDRLFCSVEGFQALCKVCHDKKTFMENEKRRVLKREKTMVKYKRSSKKNKNANNNTNLD